MQNGGVISCLGEDWTSRATFVKGGCQIVAHKQATHLLKTVPFLSTKYSLEVVLVFFFVEVFWEEGSGGISLPTYFEQAMTKTE